MIYHQPDLYDQQYDDYRDDLAFYRRLAEDWGAPVLELGAGTGRLTVALAQAGHRVVGVELAPEMLARAEARVAAAGVDARVRLLLGDMRSLELGERFPLIIAAFNTLMHAYTLRDQDATLAGVQAHLADGGAFAFDLFTPRFGPLGVLRRERVWAGVGGEQSELFVLQEHDPAEQLITSRYYLDTTTTDGVVRRQTATLQQRYFTRFELVRWLRQAGFAQVRLFGDFDRSRYHEQAPHLIGVAQR